MVDAGPPPPPRALADRDDVRQIVADLVRNAVTYTPGTAASTVACRRRRRARHRDARGGRHRPGHPSGGAGPGLRVRLPRRARPAACALPGLGAGLWVCRELAARNGGDRGSAGQRSRAPASRHAPGRPLPEKPPRHRCVAPRRSSGPSSASPRAGRSRAEPAGGHGRVERTRPRRGPRADDSGGKPGSQHVSRASAAHALRHQRLPTADRRRPVVLLGRHPHPGPLRGRDPRTGAHRRRRLRRDPPVHRGARVHLGALADQRHAAHGGADGRARRSGAHPARPSAAGRPSRARGCASGAACPTSSSSAAPRSRCPASCPG